MGKSDYEAVFSLTQLLIEHSPASDQLLHWSDEVDDSRERIERKLSPGIRRLLKLGDSLPRMPR